MEDHPQVVQVGQQAGHRAHPAGLLAEVMELRLGQGAVFPLGHRPALVFVTPTLQCLQHLQAARADGGDALKAAKAVHRVLQGFFQRTFAAPRLRAEGALARVEGVEQCILCGQLANILLRPLAAALHHDHRAVGPAEGAHVFQPVAEGVVAEHQAVRCLLGTVFEVWAPNDHEDGPGLHEQGVGPVVDVLPAEVPDV